MNLMELIDVTRSEMNAFALERGLTLKVTSTESEIIGTFDKERLMQVLRNILSNAIKFSNPGTDIRISVAQKPETITCTVSNRGVGIPRSELETIFDKFVQSSKTKTGSGGTGLGLAICKEIVEQHGGKIWAESETNEETRFVIQLPRNFQKPTEEAA
jgi:signal transduction histidine kinase